MNHKERRPIEEIAKDIVKIIVNSKATFFVNSPDQIPSKEESMRELKEEICNNVETYFYELLKASK